jgi:aminoglycoside 6'-N-acetyltransferase
MAHIGKRVAARQSGWDRPVRGPGDLGGLFVWRDMKADITLQGKRVRLRPLGEADLERFWKMIQEPEVFPWWGNDTREDLNEYLTDQENVIWAIEQGSEMIGVIQYYEEKEEDYRHAGMDILIDTSHQGQGLGSEALAVVARYLFEDKGHHRLIIDPAAANERAMASYKKVGFKPVGIMRKAEKDPRTKEWRDALLMDMLKGELNEELLK